MPTAVKTLPKTESRIERMMITAQQKELFRHIIDCNNVHIITHKSPDGDTLASAAALKHVYDLMGKRSEIICSDTVSHRLQFIVDGAEVLDATFAPDFRVCVDVATAELIGEKILGQIDGQIDFCIDHHYSNTGYAKQSIVIGDASSAGEVLYELIVSAGIEIDDFIAEKLYTAISFDTGCFKFSNAKPSTHFVAGKLLEHGFDASMINARLFDFASLEQLKLETSAINSIKQFENKKITILNVTRKMILESGIDEKDIDSLTTVARRVEGTAVSATLKETDKGYVKISLRSNEDFDVSKVAAVFGGGGHVRAAGCIIESSSEEAERRLLEVLIPEWKKYNDNSCR